ncbi:MAG TPA: NAD-dependent epimerase/dehydratase family protein [Anaerolineales bacterium]|nr:NAD-dependent epimerase/dehydratase family protein [Anaerolineales bacterium]
MNANFDGIFSGKRALVTGGLGFIGSHLARRLVHLGADVSIVDNLDPSTGANRFNIAGIEERVHLTIADVNDRKQMAALLEGQHFLFRLAAQTSHVGSLRHPMKDVEANAVAQLSILEFCRKHNPEIRIVFAGTRQVYGRPQRLPVSEDHPLAPVDYNGVSKLAGDLYHVVSHQIYGLWTTVLRLTNVYGPHMRIKDARQMFVGWWFHQMLDGGELQVYGDGQQVRDLNYVGDVVDAFLLCAAHPSAQGQVYNLGAEPIRLLDLARLMIEINGSGTYKLVPFPEERERIDIGDYYGDFSKIRAQLNWQPTIPLHKGIEQTLDFYRRYREHYL